MNALSTAELYTLKFCGFFCLFALVFQLALHPTRDLNLLGLSQPGAPELYSLKWLSLHYFELHS